MTKQRRTALSPETRQQLRGRTTSVPNWDAAVSKFTDYLALTNHSEYTIRSYQDALHNVYVTLVDLQKPPTIVSLISTADVERLIQMWLAKPLKPSSVNQKLRCLSSFLNYCQRQGYCQGNPVSEVGYLREQETEPHVLSRSEINRVYKTLQPDADFSHLIDYVLFTLLLETGLRITEAVSLRVQDVSLEKQTIAVNRTKSKRFRSVPISKRLQPVLETWLTERGTLRTDVLLVNVYEAPLTRRIAQGRLRRLAEKSDVAFSAHTLRRTFITRLVTQGTDIFTIASMTGHTSMEVMKRYVRVNDSDKQKAVDGDVW